jgi:hypothetical protein
MIAEISEAARSLALQAQVFRAATSSEIDLVFADLARDRVDALAPPVANLGASHPARP